MKKPTAENRRPSIFDHTVAAVPHRPTCILHTMAVERCGICQETQRRFIARPVEPLEPCAWSESGDGPWEGSCGVMFELIAGTPSENKMQFCPQCGKPLKEQTEISRATPTEAPTVPDPRDPFRCAVCGWLLELEAKDGCVRGNCSMRPMPERLYDRARAEAEYGVTFPGQPLPRQFRPDVLEDQPKSAGAVEGSGESRK